MNELKLYQSHKQIHARPMTWGEFEQYKNQGSVPEERAPNTEGYLVVYNKDTEDHYESWSPKHVFDEGNALIETFLDRMQREANELRERVDALVAFLQSPKRNALTGYQIELMENQALAMREYLSILQDRIAAAKISEK